MGRQRNFAASGAQEASQLKDIRDEATEAYNGVVAVDCQCLMLLYLFAAASVVLASASHQSSLVRYERE